MGDTCCWGYFASMIRLVIVDESTQARRWVANVIQGDAEITMAAEARGCVYAASLVESLAPQMVVVGLGTLLTGPVETLVNALNRRNVPVIILIENGDDRSSTIRELGFVANLSVKSIEKPRTEIEAPAWQRRFLNLIRVTSGTSVVRHVATAALPRITIHNPAVPTELVVMGASAGGPKVVGKILGSLPPLPVPLLLVMHFPASMYDYFLDWLGSISMMPVVRGAEGAPLSSLAGVVTIAVPERHMIVANGRISLTNGQKVNYCKPAVDPLFKAVAGAYGPRVVGVLLTGMGCDGAEGLLKIHQAGGTTIAQDEATSEVWGMPKAAIERGAADYVLGVDEVAGAILKLCNCNSYMAIT